MSASVGFAGDPNIGVFSRVFDDIAIIPPGAPGEFGQALRTELGVEVLVTTIQQSVVIGSLVAGNQNGLVVSGLALPDEIAVLEDRREVLCLHGGMTAAGNLILANDYFAAVHPDIPLSVAEEIGSFLGVPVVRLTLGGVKTVGMAGCATNSGVLIHPRSSPREIAILEGVCELPIGLGTVNMGTALVGTGLVANRRGYLAGLYTSGFEMGRIEEVFGFVE
ncbi:MAG: translation initiation factor IF-6 [Methanoculleaceae archaeon]